MLTSLPQSKANGEIISSWAAPETAALGIFLNEQVSQSFVLEVCLNIIQFKREMTSPSETKSFIIPFPF